MIAADSSTVVAWLKGLDGPDVARLAEALDAGDLVLPPPVVAELLSWANGPVTLKSILVQVNQLPIADGF